MIYPIRLNTAYGADQFSILIDQKKHYDKLRLSIEWKQRCAEDYQQQERLLNWFLDDINMSRKYPMTEDDTEGFSIFNKMSDVVSALKYFAG